MTGTSTGASPPTTAREPEHLTRNRRVDAAHTPRRQNQMKSIAQIVQPRFLSRYASEPMDAAAVEGLLADSGIAYAQTFAEANGLKLGGASHVGMVYFRTLTKKSAIGEAGK